MSVRPGVYKMPMVRMNENSDEYPNVRVYIFRKSKRLLSNLKGIYAKIEVMEQGKVRTQKMSAVSVLAGKLYDITCFYLTESGGTTDEVAVMAMEEQPPVKSEERQIKLH